LPPAVHSSVDSRVVKAIAHPLRHRILAILNERVASPKQLSDELDERLANVSYHFKKLENLGAIELVDTAPRRGAVEHYYRALMRPFFSDDSWAQLPTSTRRSVFESNLRHIFSDVGSALAGDGFDDSQAHVSRTPVVLDEKGYEQMTDLLAKTLDRVLEIQEKAAARMVRTAEDGRVTEVVIMHFDKAPASAKTSKAKPKRRRRRTT
jgi:DNA-binding transcriptional ArsR family regulator